MIFLKLEVLDPKYDIPIEELLTEVDHLQINFSRHLGETMFSFGFHKVLSICFLPNFKLETLNHIFTAIDKYSTVWIYLNCCSVLLLNYKLWGRGFKTSFYLSYFQGKLKPPQRAGQWLCENCFKIFFSLCEKIILMKMMKFCGFLSKHFCFLAKKNEFRKLKYGFLNH